MEHEAEFAEIRETLVAAAGLADAAMPRRPWGDAWFRHNEPYLSVTAVASVVHDELVRADLDKTPEILTAADRLLTEIETDSARELIEIGLVEAIVCLASHSGDADVGGRFLSIAPPELGRIWRRRTSRLDALAAAGVATGDMPPSGLGSDDPGTRLLAGAAAYLNDDGRWLDLEEIVSADDPSPWILRHPVATGFIFLAILTAFFLLSLATGAGPFLRE